MKEIKIFEKFILILSLILITKYETSFGFEEFGQKLDYISLPYKEMKNLTCTSHEASFICDCRNMKEMDLFLPPLDGNVYQIIVTNCDALTVGPNLLRNVQGLGTVTFQNIKELILQKNSLSFRMVGRSRKLIFQQVQTIQIDSLAIDGNIEEIIFRSSGIGNVQSFGITTKTETGIIRFDSCYVDVIDVQAFKRFALDKLIITNTIFTSPLRSHAFYEMKVQQLIIQNVTFLEVNALAFQFEEINSLLISDNNFVKTNGNWIKGDVKSAITIENNSFGETSPIAFQGLQQHKNYAESTKIDFRFSNNILFQLLSNSNDEVQPLEFDQRLNLMLRNLTFGNHFPCYIADRLDSKSFYKIFADTVYFQTEKNATIYKTVHNLLETDCKEVSYLAYIISGSILLILLLIAITIGVICYIMRKKAAQQLNINPEPRTYEESQIVLKVENAGLLKTDL